MFKLSQYMMRSTMSSLPATADLDPAMQIQAWMRAHVDEMLDTLEALVRVESPTHDPSAQRQVFELLTALLDKLDYHTTRLPGKVSGGAIFARPRHRTKRAPYQLLVGHGDTVWEHGTLDEIPFSVTDGIARGPGTYDMKGGLVQMLFALRGLRELGLEPEVTPALFINSDEELGSSDSSRHVSRLAKWSDRAFVLEPSLGPTGKIKTARKGVGQFAITVHGKAAHAGLCPEDGISAILEMSHVIQTVNALNDPSREITVNIGKITGGTGANVVPARAEIVVDIRLLTRADATQIESSIRNIGPTLPGAELTVEGGFIKAPMEQTARNLRLWEIARAAGERLGIPLEHGRAGGASDGNTTSLHTATIDGLGAVGGGAHARHEFLRIDKMPERAALLALLLLAPEVSADGRVA